MKRIILPLAIIVLLLAFVSCDRFNHNFAPDDPQETPIEKFEKKLTNVIKNLEPSEEDSLALAFLYSENYLNNGCTKDETVDYFINLASNDSVKFEVDSLEFSPQTNEFSWHFKAFWEENTFADTTFNDILTMSDSTYCFYGNQSYGYGKTNVLVEFVSSTNCDNCIPVSNKLKRLEAENDNFIFLTACYDKPDTPADYIDVFLLYYPFIGYLPTSFFQGKFKLQGYTEDIITQYDARTTQISEWDARASISNIQLSTNNSEDTCSVDLSIWEGVMLDNLYLRCALIEKESSLQYNPVDSMHNVVFGYEKILVENYNQTIKFKISSYYESLPDDTEIVLWLQRMPADYDEETCKVIAAKNKEI